MMTNTVTTTEVMTFAGTPHSSDASAVSENIETPVDGSEGNDDLAHLALDSALWCSEQDAAAGLGEWDRERILTAAAASYRYLIGLRDEARDVTLKGAVLMTTTMRPSARAADAIERLDELARSTWSDEALTPFFGTPAYLPIMGIVTAIENAKRAIFDVSEAQDA